MKNPLKGFTIAVSGDFGAGRAEPNIRRWVENSGGKFTSKLTKDTTHVICTKEHWKKPVAAGRSPDQRSLERFFPVHILTF